jgi:hypothetical protein
LISLPSPKLRFVFSKKFNLGFRSAALSHNHEASLTIVRSANVVPSNVAALITYRKPTANLFWHFDPACSHWPFELYEQVIAGVPPRGAFCRRCANMCIEKFRLSWTTWFILRVGGRSDFCEADSGPEYL